MCSICWWLCWSSPSWQHFVQSWHICQGYTAWRPHSLGWCLHHWNLTGTPAWFSDVSLKTLFQCRTIGFLLKTFSLKSWVEFYLCFMYQKMVAQPKPVATLRWESGLGKEDRKSALQRPSCQVISWLRSLGMNLMISWSSLSHSQPKRERQMTV